MASSDESSQDDEKLSPTILMKDDLKGDSKCGACGKNSTNCRCNGADYVSNGDRNGIGKAVFVNKLIVWCYCDTVFLMKKLPY